MCVCVRSTHFIWVKDIKTLPNYTSSKVLRSCFTLTRYRKTAICKRVRLSYKPTDTGKHISTHLFNTKLNTVFTLQSNAIVTVFGLCGVLSRRVCNVSH